MVQLQQNLEKIETAGLQVVGVSYDPVATLKEFSDEAGIKYPLLSDEGSKTIKTYGLHFRDGLPNPGTFVIDKIGTVRAALFLEGYRERHAIEELIEAAKKLE